jgi:hypothetical protein
VVIDRARVTTDHNVRIADVENGPDGCSLYFSTWIEIWRLKFNSLNCQPLPGPTAPPPSPPGPNTTQPPAKIQPDRETPFAPIVGVAALVVLAAAARRR